jgi:ABC-type antimicrobial peptide transport system permease subunit
MAIGATQREIVRLVVFQGMTLAVAGVGIGLAAAFVFARLMRSLLFGISTADPVTFAGISLLLTFVALLVTYIPARRAARIDPILCLRAE